MEEEKFESRVLTEWLDIIAVMDHLHDNLDKRPQIILTIGPRRVSESDYCSIKGTSIKTIQIKNERGISDTIKFLVEKLFIADIHVAIK